MTLRVTVDYHADETRVSLLSRLAIANGYSSLKAFLSLNGTSVLPFERGENEAIVRLSEWSGVETNRLQSFDIRGNGAGATWTLGAASMSKDMRIGYSHRYCPRCVINDMENGKGRPQTRPYVRATWMTRAVQTCAEHHCTIVEVSTDDASRDDFARHVEKNLSLIKGQISDNDPQDVGLARYVTSRIEGERTNDFLDQFETYVAVDLCRHLGRFHARHRSDQVEAVTSATKEIDLGFKIASNGPECIESVISGAVSRQRPPALEIQAFFGKLRRWLLRNKAKDEFTELIELFQDIVERNIPIGQDELFVLHELFVLPTRRRYLHSVRSASTEYGMLEERVLQLVLDAGLVEPASRTNGRIYFDAEKGHKVLSSAIDTLTAPEMASELGIHIDRMRGIFEANILRRVEVSQQGRVYSRVNRSDFEAIKDRLDVPEATAIERETLVSVGRAAQSTFCTIIDILSLALEKRLSTLRRLDGSGILSGLGIDPNELEPLAKELMKARAEASSSVFDSADPTSELLTTRQARELLATAPNTVRELVQMNYISLKKGFNPKTKRTNDYICASSVKNFMSEHISLVHLAEQKKMFAVTVRDKLALLGVKSVFEPTGRNSRYYLKSDVLDLDLS